MTPRSRTPQRQRYREHQACLADLARSLGADDLRRVVPGCPAWTVHELVAHVVGVAADNVAGRTEGAPGQGWTSAQVEARRGRPVDDLLAEWDALLPGVDAFLDAAERPSALVYDVVMHDDDLREALALPLGDTATNRWVLRGLAFVAGTKVSGAGLPAVGLSGGDVELVAGEGQPAAELDAGSPQELGRVLGGRRDDAAVRALRWSGESAPYLPHLRLFG